MARETKGSGDNGFPVLDSGTSGPHVCSREVSIYCMESHDVFNFRSRFLSSKQSIKKIRINSKTPFPQSPSFLVSRSRRLEKRSEKSYGDENGPHRVL